MTFPSVQSSARPVVRTSARPVVRLSPLLVNVFLFANISVSIHRIAFIFYIQLPKDIGNTFPYILSRKIFFCYCKFRRFRLKFFKVLLTWKCVAGLLLNFIKTFFITFAIVSQPFSVKIVICNSQFTHFSTGVDFDFFTTIFRLVFSG